MLLLTAITFGGQEGIDSLEYLPEEEAEQLRHRAQEILQIPRDKRIPLLVQEIKRLVKDRRGQLWNAEPERLAELLRRERSALVEVLLRALPSSLAEAVRGHLPPTRVRLTREVRPQVLDIVRWKLEELLAREASSHVPFRFTDVLQLQARELLTLCDRLGARVLGPALAGLKEEEREAAFASLPPHQRQLATRSVTANAPRKLGEEEARAQLEPHGGLENLALALRSAGVHRLARACVAQSPEFAARLLEKHRGEFGQLLGRWIREERTRPTSRGDGGRTDIVTDLERLAARGLVERPMRMPTVRTAGAQPSPGGKPVARGPSVSRELRTSGTDGGRRASVVEQVAVRRAGAVPTSQFVPSKRRDPIAEREARRAGASSRLPGREASGAAQDGSKMHRIPLRREVPGRTSGSGISAPDVEGSRIFRSPVARGASRTGLPREEEGREGARPPRVLRTNSSGTALPAQGGTSVRRAPPGPRGRGSRGGKR